MSEGYEDQFTSGVPTGVPSGVPMGREVEEIERLQSDYRRRMAEAASRTKPTPDDAPDVSEATDQDNTLSDGAPGNIPAGIPEPRPLGEIRTDEEDVVAADRGQQIIDALNQAAAQGMVSDIPPPSVSSPPPTMPTPEPERGVPERGVPERGVPEPMDLGTQNVGTPVGSTAGGSEPGTPEREPDPGEHPLEEFESLARLGYMRGRLVINGHTIDLRTLNQREELHLLEETGMHPISGRMRALQLYTVALAVERIDGEEFLAYTALGGTADVQARKAREYRFGAVSDELSPQVIEVIYDRYLDMRESLNLKAAWVGKEYPRRERGRA